MITVSRKRGYQIVVLGICFFYFLLLSLYLPAIKNDPYLGIKLQKVESSWKVDSAMSMGVAKNLGIEKGDIILSTDGASPSTRKEVHQWSILERVKDITVLRDGHTLKFSVPSNSPKMLLTYMILALFSLSFICLGLVVYIKRQFLTYSKYFLSINALIGLILLIAIPSSFGFTLARILFSISIIWLAFMLVTFIMYFPIYIKKSLLSKVIQIFSFCVSLLYTLYMSLHLLDVLPYQYSLFFIKSIMLPIFLAMLVISFLLLFVTSKYIHQKEHKQLNILLFCTLFSYLPTIIFYMLPVVSNSIEINFTGTSFFLFLFPVACAYIMLKKGRLVYTLHVPNNLIKFFYTIFITVSLFILYTYQARTGKIVVIFVFSFIFLWGIQGVYRAILDWNTTKLQQDKHHDHLRNELAQQYNHTHHMVEMLVYILDQLDAFLPAEGSFIVWSKHSQTKCKQSRRVKRTYAGRVRINKNGKLSFSDVFSKQMLNVIPIQTYSKEKAYLVLIGIVPNDTQSNVLLETYIKQLEHCLISILTPLEKRKLLRDNNQETVTYPDEDFLLVRKIEEEKEKISNFLHDSVIQHLSFIQRELKEIKGGKSHLSEANLPAMINVMDDVLYELRYLCFDLYPQMVEDLGLKSSIKQFTADLQLSSNLKIELTYENFRENHLEKRLTVTLFRIIQELLNNVVKHAKASLAKVNLKMTDEQIIIVVTDNGIGLKKEFLKSNHRNFGLVSIQKNIKAFNGAFELIPEHPTGLSAVICIPVRRRLENNENQSCSR